MEDNNICDQVVTSLVVVTVTFVVSALFRCKKIHVNKSIVRDTTVNVNKMLEDIGSNRLIMILF